MVAWSAKALVSHSLDYSLCAGGGSNPIVYGVLIAQSLKRLVTIRIVECQVRVIGFIIHATMLAVKLPSEAHQEFVICNMYFMIEI